VQWSPGIRPDIPEQDILFRDPKKRPGFPAQRIFRGVTYNIDVKRSGVGEIVSLKANDAPIEGEISPISMEGE